jgi:SAM-dependent methyltransferase
MHRWLGGGPMADNTTHFDDAASYDRFMGRWSRGVGSVFLDWLSPPAGARWLEVGCGSGAFTGLVLGACAPASMSAVDPSKSQIDYVSGQPMSQRVDFRIADAQALPFADATFDIVASALVLNFIPDRPHGLREMRRVTRPGGVVAGYVWDFAAERGPSRPLRAGMLGIGVDPRAQSGAEDTSLAALKSLFANAGFQQIETTTIDVSLDFPDFDEYWQAQTPPLHPYVKTIAALPEADRARLVELVRAELTARPDGSITTSARANAFKARAPG